MNPQAKPASSDLDLIARAAACPTLGDGCALIQDAIGVTDGGLAALVFSDLNGDDEWLEWDADTKREGFAHYLSVERTFAAEAA